MHLPITDKTREFVIFEYIDGDLHIHYGEQYNMIASEPSYNSKFTINTCWTTVGHCNFLPGTNRVADCFAHASWIVDAVPPSLAGDAAEAEVRSLVHAISAPLCLSDPQKPNIAATRWRTVADLDAGHYFFESVHTPAVFWVHLSKLHLKDGAPSLRLDLSGKRILTSEVSKEFKPAKAFEFMAQHNSPYLIDQLGCSYSLG